MFLVKFPPFSVLGSQTVPLMAVLKNVLCISSLRSNGRTSGAKVVTPSITLVSPPFSLPSLAQNDLNLMTFNSSRTSFLDVQSYLFANIRSMLAQLSWSMRKWLSKKFKALPCSVFRNIPLSGAAGTSYELQRIKKILQWRGQLSSRFPENGLSWGMQL